MRSAISSAIALVLAAALLRADDRGAWMGRADWMQEARFGVMTHYLADWMARVHQLDMNVDEWNRLIDNFDVETLAGQLESAGVRYYQISIGQNSGYYLSPNTTLARYMGRQSGRCSRRDLVADLYTALNRHHIKLMVYLPSHPGGPELRKALGWETSDRRKAEGQRRWEEVIREWSTRWGQKVTGWWFDGCYFPNSMYYFPDPPNFASLAAAARSGNPDSIVAFNPGVYPRIHSMTPYEDFTAGEIDEPGTVVFKRDENGKADGVQMHILTFLGEKWGMGDPRFRASQVAEWSRNIWKKHAAVTWDTPVQLNGTISQPFLDQLKAIGRALQSER